MAPNPRGALFFPANAFGIQFSKFLTKSFKHFGITRTHNISRFPGRPSFYVLPAIFVLTEVGFCFYYLGPRVRARITEDRKHLAGYMDRFDLPKDFDPLDEAHLEKFTAKRQEIINDRLGWEVRDEYNPLKPAYYLHTLPPKDSDENVAWARKGRDWDDYKRWIEAKHPDEYQLIQSGKYWRQ
eukprot:209044_1